MEKSHERGLAGNAAWSARDRQRHLPRGVSKIITAEALSDAIASFDEDLAEGRYVDADIVWRATLRRARELSRAHTPALGCRTLDVLHVAIAIELGLRYFVTFDSRQGQLAKAAGLKPLTPV